MDDKDEPIPLADDDELLKNAIPIDQIEDEDDAKPAAAGHAAREEPEPVEIAEGDATGPRQEIQRFEKRRHVDTWSRTPNVNKSGAIHVKTFVSKLRLDAIEHMDQQINEWLDAHPEYEVKFVCETVGSLVGKNTEPAIFLSVWV